MKKSLGRAFIFSFIAFALVGLLFLIIAYSIGDSIDVLFTMFSQHPGLIIEYILRPLRYFPWEIFNEFFTTLYVSTKTWYIGMFVALIIASLVAGITGGSIKNAFLGWALMMIFSIILYIIPFSFDYLTLNHTCGSCTYLEGVIKVVFIGIIHILIFGCITIFTALIIGRRKKY
ncbi:MAG: hypothetical protein JSV62_10815 [Promethearchaeota archaeon]|nr:MAG: hypothetical protein JSV62_10815 [Candidatus Lokiarchaeota archaeon]